MTTVYSGRDPSTMLHELLPDIPYTLKLLMWDRVGSATNDSATTSIVADFSLPQQGFCGNFDDLSRFRCVATQVCELLISMRCPCSVMIIVCTLQVATECHGSNGRVCRGSRLLRIARAWAMHGQAHCYFSEVWNLLRSRSRLDCSILQQRMCW